MYMSATSQSAASKPRRATIPRVVQLAVWEKYIGTITRGACFVCERAPITILTNVEYGHVVAVADGGNDSIDNLRPICSACNRAMGTRNLLEYKDMLAHSGVCPDIRAEMYAYAHESDHAATILIEAFNPRIDDEVFANLQLLSDSQIDTLAYALDITRCSANKRREIIATYTNPAMLSAQRKHNDKLRALLANMDDKLIARLFTSRKNALHIFGFM